MTDDLDAPATLRQMAALATEAAFRAMNSQPIGSQSRSALSNLCYELNEIAIAPAVAKDGDAPRLPEACREAATDAPEQRPRSTSDHVGSSDSASPADPFAPMVEAALLGWHPTCGSDTYEQRMRRALAAAIEKAPYPSEMSGSVTTWLATNRALAAELRGKP